MQHCIHTVGSFACIQMQAHMNDFAFHSYVKKINTYLAFVCRILSIELSSELASCWSSSSPSKHQQEPARTSEASLRCRSRRRIFARFADTVGESKIVATPVKTSLLSMKARGEQVLHSRCGIVSELERLPLRRWRIRIRKRRRCRSSEELRGMTKR